MNKHIDYELAFALDNTGVRMFMYYPQKKTITVPKNACKAYQCKAVYENMPQSFADDFVYEPDHSAFNEMYYKIDRGEKTANTIFHSHDLNFCHHVTLTTVSWTADGKPDEVIGIIENISDAYKSEKLVQNLQNKLNQNIENDDSVQEAVNLIANVISESYRTIYHIWLEDLTYVSFQDEIINRAESIGDRIPVNPKLTDIFVDKCVETIYQNAVRKFFALDTLAVRLREENHIQQVYRRNKYGWTKAEFTVAKRDSNGDATNVIFSVRDINRETETEIRKQEAEQEALHDPLTKMWNRKAFELFKEDKDYKNNQSGLLLFDIDRFKGINDQYGHEVGDQVIIETAQAVRGILRPQDLVFRVGGDEFAALLYNCNSSIWKTSCRKIETVHADLKQIFPFEMNVTISAGLCINEDGYCDEMYKLADHAMYNTKANGRAGCSWTDIKGDILAEWHDHSSFLRKGDVLEKNSTVTWRLDKPKKPELKHRAFGDELFCDFVGLNSSATPEELYQAWADRVEPGYFEVLQNAAKMVIEDGKSEAVFNWKHPEKGLVQLRSSASIEAETDDYYTLIGYIHVITGIHVATIEDIDAKIKNALEKMYFCSFYIKLEDYSFKVHKAQEYMLDMLESSKNAITVVDSYIKYMVADDSKGKMAAFLDLTTIRHRMKNTDVIGTDYNDPNIGWSRAKFVVVDRDEHGEAETVSLIVEAIE